MHWIDRKARNILNRGGMHVVASGISISGHIHIGHSKDVFIADAVHRSIKEKGMKSKVIWYSDDFDPMRRIPWPLNEEEYRRYLGMPYIDIPSPDSEYESFVEYFASPFIESLGEFGIKADIYHSSEVYRQGKLSKQIRRALENTDKIREILNKYRRNPLSEGWLPFDAVCGKCGKIATTRALDWRGDKVKYECIGTEYTDGCDHTGRADFTEGEGKLTWRVEWPARWKMLGVTCEPFGKDHAASGGSYDTGKLISREIFDYEPPEPIPYEWISLKEKPMSSSKGQVFTLAQWLEIAEPEILRYFIFRSKSMKAKNFDPGLPLLDLYDEYDNLEDIYFGEKDVPDSREKQLKRIYELSQTNGVPEKRPQRIPFRLATIVCQIISDPYKVIEILRKKDVIDELNQSETELIKKRLSCAKKWIEKYAPESERLKLLDELNNELKQKLSQNQKNGLSQLAEYIMDKDPGSEEIHNQVYETARELEMKPGKLFTAIYLVLLGEKYGPRVGNFVTALETEFVVERFKEASIQG